MLRALALMHKTHLIFCLAVWMIYGDIYAICILQQLCTNACLDTIIIEGINHTYPSCKQSNEAEVWVKEPHKHDSAHVTPVTSVLPACKARRCRRDKPRPVRLQRTCSEFFAYCTFLLRIDFTRAAAQPSMKNFPDAEEGPAELEMGQILVPQEPVWHSGIYRSRDIGKSFV